MDAKTMRALGNHLVMLADSIDNIIPETKGAKKPNTKVEVEQKIKTNIKEEMMKKVIMTPEMIKVTKRLEEKIKKGY